MRTPLALDALELVTERGGWMLVPALRHVVFTEADDAAARDPVLEREVLRMAAALDLDGAEYLDLLPAGSFSLVRPEVMLRSKQAATHGEAKRKAALELLASIGRRVWPSTTAVMPRCLSAPCLTSAFQAAWRRAAAMTARNTGVDKGGRPSRNGRAASDAGRRMSRPNPALRGPGTRMRGGARLQAASSSIQTRKPLRVLGPKVWVSGTSAASRPRAISTRPRRGALLRGSKAHQRPPR